MTNLHVIHSGDRCIHGRLYTSLNIQPIFKRNLFRFVSKTVQRKRMSKLRVLAQNLIKKKTVQIDQLMHLYVCHSVSQDRSSYTLSMVNIRSASASRWYCQELLILLDHLLIFRLKLNTRAIDTLLTKRHGRAFMWWKFNLTLIFKENF